MFGNQNGNIATNANDQRKFHHIHQYLSCILSYTIYNVPFVGCWRVRRLLTNLIPTADRKAKQTLNLETLNLLKDTHTHTVAFFVSILAVHSAHSRNHRGNKRCNAGPPTTSLP